MPKTSVEPHRVVKHGKKYWRVIIPKAVRNGTRERFFEVKEDAMDFCATLTTQKMVSPAPLIALSVTDQLRIAHCINKAGGIDRLEDAVAAFSRSNPAGVTRMTVSAAVSECVAAKLKGERRQNYVEQLEDVLNIFKRGRESRQISEITPNEIQEWLESRGLSGWTRRGYLGRVKTLFSFCVRQGYCPTDPTERVEKPAVNDTDIAVITVDQGKALLKAAVEVDKGIATLIALQMFGYLRPHEARRFTIAELQGGHIDVKGRKAKTRSRRVIKINETLRAWIKLGHEVPTTGVRERMDKVRSKAGIPWAKDCLRHTCVSCSYVTHGARQTSEWAGHSEDILFRHYRALVSEEAADQWWKLTPDVVTRSS